MKGPGLFILVDAMYTRHGGHRQEIKNQTNKLGTHFAHCGIETFKLQSIDSVQEGKDIILIQLEGVWRNRLATICFSKCMQSVFVKTLLIINILVCPKLEIIKFMLSALLTVHCAALFCI